MDIVEDQTIGDEMAILDSFALECAVVRSNQSLTPKEDPAEEAIKGLAFVGGGLNRLPEIGITEIPEEDPHKRQDTPGFP
jgi:hypothetical protein